MTNIKFGVNILKHLKNQLKNNHLTPKAKKDLSGLIKHLEAGRKYEDYQGPGKRDLPDN